MYSFEPAGFLQIAFLDYREFDQDHDDLILMKTRQMPPISPREKIPFEVTPINLYLTRCVAVSEEGEHSIVPMTASPVAGAAGQY